jgi:hypothetical protein
VKWLSLTWAWLRSHGTALLVAILSIVLAVVYLLLRAANRREAEAKIKNELAGWKAKADEAYARVTRDNLAAKIAAVEQADAVLVDQIAKIPVRSPIKTDTMSAEAVAEELRRRGF